ncbi:MAG: YdcF family protein [Verrucomicrobia bacterium]|nr:YdcF family protein [Verrucomicrobiota bacterium]
MLAGRSLFQRRELWTLSRRGWIVLFLLFFGTCAFMVWRIHPFLAVTDRLETEYLVVEGWIPNYALTETISELKSNHYRLVFTVGGGSRNGVDVESGDNDADYAARRLKWLGVEPEVIQPVPAHVLYRDRTYKSALALLNWIEERRLPVTSFNLVSVGVHARRSRLLFEKAFKGHAQVGIISVEDREYDPERWWKYSEGVKEILSEGTAYFYTRLAFWR